MKRKKKWNGFVSLHFPRSADYFDYTFYRNQTLDTYEALGFLLKNDFVRSTKILSTKRRALLNKVLKELNLMIRDLNDRKFVYKRFDSASMTKPKWISKV